MIIAVNKCPQNITLKAFNLSQQIYIYIYIISVSIFPKMDRYGETVRSKTVIE